MKVFNLFKRDKRRYDYFESFRVISSKVEAVVNLLDVTLEESVAGSYDEVLSDVGEIEVLVNERKNELLSVLYKDFLPPIERRDLLVLTYAVVQVFSDVVDVVVALDMYSVEIEKAELKQLVDYLSDMVRDLPGLMLDLEDFKHPKKLKKMLGEIDGRVDEGISFYRELVKVLFIAETNSVEIMKYTKVYEAFLVVFQSIGDLVYLVEAVVIENG